MVAVALAVEITTLPSLGLEIVAMTVSSFSRRISSYTSLVTIACDSPIGMVTVIPDISS